MTMPIADGHFIDTNILVYAHLPTSPWHAAAVSKLKTLETMGVELWISRQTMREYLAAMTKPGVITTPNPALSLATDVRYFAGRFRIAEDGPAVTTELLNLVSTIPMGGKQIHDANIVATMLTHGIPKLLTNNTADFARFASLITVVPLVP